MRETCEAAVYAAIRDDGDLTDAVDRDVDVTVEPDGDDKIAVRANSDDGRDGVVAELVLDPRDAETLVSRIQGVLDA